MTIRRIRVDAGTQLFLHDLDLDGWLSYAHCICQGDAYHNNSSSCHQLLYVGSWWSLESRKSMRSKTPAVDIGAGSVTSRELHKLKQKDNHASNVICTLGR
jgi:hypothetical protein